MTGRSCCADPVGCRCDPLAPPEPVVANQPAQPALRWRVAPHSHALARVRAALADTEPPAVRALAAGAVDDPVLALVDAWAVVADTVSFYTERIAQEGFVRTATELDSVRRLARAIGYELRPGVAAEAEIAFDVETAPGAPAVVDVPRGTAVQSVPGPGQLPQTFETTTDLTARAAWNAIPGAAFARQDLGYGTEQVWVRGTTALRPGDGVLLVGAERRRFARTPDHVRGAALERRDDERWDFRVVDAIEAPAEAPGWTLLRLEERVGYRRNAHLTAETDVEVHAFARRANLFGWSAPDPSLITPPEGTDPPATGPDGDWAGIDSPLVAGTADVIELDTDLAGVVAGSWLVLESAGYRELYLAEAVRPGGLTRFAVSGKATRVRVDMTESLARFGRRDTLVRCESAPLAAADAPVLGSVTGSSVLVEATDPPLPVGRVVVVTGFGPGERPADPVVAAATPPPLAEVATVVAATVTEDPRLVQVDLDPPLTQVYDPQTVRVRANVVLADHGETVRQVLGSGDATVPFQRLATRRGPLTHVRRTGPGGATPELEVRVDDVAWQQVESLDVAGPTDRVYVARVDSDGIAEVTTGDGLHGSRLRTGTENVEAVYRVGLGADGALDAGQLSMLPRRPLGVAAAVNPAPSHDWAPPEDLLTARSTAPQRIRTLDRVVSVADHEDLAAGYDGVGQARADAVWDGRATVTVVSLLATLGTAPGTGLTADLRDTLAAVRDPGTPFVVLPGEVLGFEVEVAVRHDPGAVRSDVHAAVIADLEERYGAAARRFADPVTPARVLVDVRAVPGVIACTMPVLRRPGAPADGRLRALAGRFVPGRGLAGAQLLTVSRVTVTEMP